MSILKEHWPDMENLIQAEVVKEEFVLPPFADGEVSLEELKPDYLIKYQPEKLEK